MQTPFLKPNARGTYVFARFLNGQPLDVKSNSFEVVEVRSKDFKIRDLSTDKIIFCGLPKNQKPNGKEWQTSKETSNGFENEYTSIWSGGTNADGFDIKNREVVQCFYSFLF